MEGKTNDANQVVSFSYSTLDEDKGNKNGKVSVSGAKETARGSFINPTRFIIIYVITTLVFAAFFIACLVLLVRNQPPDVTDKEFFNITLSRKLEILRKDVEEMISSAQLSKPSTYRASNQRVYELHKDLKNYTEAEMACSESDARLAAEGIRDRAVLRELLQFLRSHPMSSLCWGNQCYWIGLKFSDVTLEWEWSDGLSNSSTAKWAPGEPNTSTEDCAVLYVEHEEVHDYHCDKKFYYLCEGLLPEEEI